MINLLDSTFSILHQFAENNLRSKIVIASLIKGKYINYEDIFLPSSASIWASSGLSWSLILNYPTHLFACPPTHLHPRKYQNGRTNLNIVKQNWSALCVDLRSPLGEIFITVMNFYPNEECSLYFVRKKIFLPKTDQSNLPIISYDHT